MTGPWRAALCALMLACATSACGLDAQQHPERIPQEQLPSPRDVVSPDVPTADE